MDKGKLESFKWGVLGFIATAVLAFAAYMFLDSVYRMGRIDGMATCPISSTVSAK